MAHLADLQNCSRRDWRRSKSGVNKRTKDFDPFREARAWAGKVAGGVHGKNAGFTNGGQFIPSIGELHAGILRCGLIGAIAAGHGEDYFGPRGQNLLGGDAERRLAQTSENVLAAGASHHFRDPVPAAIKRVEPLETCDAQAAVDPGNRALDAGNAFLELRNQQARFGTAARGIPHGENVAPDIRQGVRIERNDLRHARQAAERGAEIAGRSCADVTQVLRHDNVGSNLEERFRIFRVRGFQRLQPRVDLQSRDDMALSAAEAIVSLSRGQWPAEKVVNPEVRARFRW